MDLLPNFRARIGFEAASLTNPPQVCLGAESMLSPAVVGSWSGLRYRGYPLQAYPGQHVGV